MTMMKRCADNVRFVATRNADTCKNGGIMKMEFARISGKIAWYVRAQVGNNFHILYGNKVSLFGPLAYR